MPARHARHRLLLAVVAGFALGGGSAEVVVRTKAALDKAREGSVPGSAGQLVTLALHDADGELVASPRLVCPAGKSAELFLRDPLRPDEVKLALRVEATRDASGEVALDWSLAIPEHAVAERGRIALQPGVEHAIPVGDSHIVATWLALPVPSAAFDAWLEAEATRRAGGPQI